MPIEFLAGQPLSREELDLLRHGLETAERIEVVNDELRAIVERNWPHLIPKLPPLDDRSLWHHE
jgi:hypothetical protein